MDPLVNQGQARSQEKAGVSSGAKREAAPGRAARDAGGTEAQLSQPPARSPGEPANTDRTLGWPGLNSGISTEPHRPAVGGRQLFLSICWEGGQRTPREGKQRPHYTGGGGGGGGEGGCKANTQLGPEAGSALLTGRLDGAGPAPIAPRLQGGQEGGEAGRSPQSKERSPGDGGWLQAKSTVQSWPRASHSPRPRRDGTRTPGRQPEAGGRLGQQAGPGPLWARGPDSRRASCADRAAAEWPAWLPQTAEQASARASGLGPRTPWAAPIAHSSQGFFSCSTETGYPSLLAAGPQLQRHTRVRRSCSSPVTQAGGTAHHGCPGHTRP